MPTYPQTARPPLPPDSFVPSVVLSRYLTTGVHMKHRITLLAAALAGTALASPAAPAAPAAAASTTRLTITVEKCNGCLVEAYTPMARDVGPHARATVRRGRVVLKLSSADTKGLALFVHWQPGAPDYAGDAVPIPAFRVAGVQPGQAVSARAATNTKRAWTCWAGTKASAYTIHLKAVLYPSAYQDGRRGTAIAFYASPALATVGKGWATKNPGPRRPGVAAASQDIPYCG